MASDRAREADAAGQKWAEEKAAALEGTSPRDWPEEWDAAWNGELHLEPHRPRLEADELAQLIERATSAARQRWAEIVEEARGIEESQTTTDAEARAVALYEAIRDHVPAGLAVGREGARVYIQDVADSGETTVTSIADAARAINDWQERHFGR
jgi:hypothetical protein